MRLVCIVVIAVNVHEKYYVLFDFHSPKRMNSSAVKWKIYDDFSVYSIHSNEVVYVCIYFSLFSIEWKESPRLVSKIMQPFVMLKYLAVVDIVNMFILYIDMEYFVV